MEDLKKNVELAIKLFEIGAFLDKTKSPDGNGFKLKLHDDNPEASLSPFYLNFRTPDNPKPGPLTPEIVDEIGQILCQEFIGLVHAGLVCHQVAGVPRAGDPLAEAFFRVWRSKKPSNCGIIKLGKEESPQGRRVTKIIRGDWDSGEIILLIDDLITQADSKLEAIETLKKAGLVVRDVLVLVDREQGGERVLKENGYNLHSVFKFSDLLVLYQYKNLIGQRVYEEIKSYLHNN